MENHSTYTHTTPSSCQAPFVTASLEARYPEAMSLSAEGRQNIVRLSNVDGGLVRLHAGDSTSKSSGRNISSLIHHSVVSQQWKVEEASPGLDASPPHPPAPPTPAGGGAEGGAV